MFFFFLFQILRMDRDLEDDDVSRVTVTGRDRTRVDINSNLVARAYRFQRPSGVISELQQWAAAR